MIIQRRNFLIGLASALAAPAIVKAESLMKVKSTIIKPQVVHFSRIPQATWRALNQGIPYAKSPIEDLMFVPVTRC